MIVSIHQPNYFPWPGFFYKIFKSDIFVLLDDVQFSNEGMHNYHYLKTPQGSFRLKVPVEYNFGDQIIDVRTKDNLNWKTKHLKTIEANYRNAAFFGEVFKDIEEWINQDEGCLSILNEKIIRGICQKLGIRTQIIRSSEMGIKAVKSSKIIEICKRLNASEYLSGTGARSYQVESAFIESGISLKYINYNPVEYDQLWGTFIANVSIIDFIMNCGYNWNIISDNQRN